MLFKKLFRLLVLGGAMVGTTAGCAVTGEFVLKNHFGWSVVTFVWSIAAHEPARSEQRDTRRATMTT